MGFTRTTAVAALASFALGGAMSGAAEAQTRYSVATAAATSGYYRMFSPAAEYINKNSSKIRLTPLSTDGSVENARRVGSGQLHFGAGSMVELPDAFTGKGAFDKPLTDLRVVGPALAPSFFYFLVRKDSGVEKLADLEGKSFGCGAPGAAGTIICKQVLEAVGLKGKVDVVELPYDQLTDMVANRDIVGMVRAASGLPAGFLEELNVRIPLHLIDMKAFIDDKEKMKAVPATSRNIVPAGTYKWQPGSPHLLSVPTFFIANKNTPEDDVHEFVKIMNSKGMIDHMENAYKGHGFYPKNDNPLPALPFPLHPGAAKFWKEVGVTAPEPVTGG